jgi:general secretion pathway protein D
MKKLRQLRLALLDMHRPARFCAVLSLCLCCCAALAQGAPPGDLKSYALRYKTAAEVGRMLSELLGRDAELIVDARANRILVRGPEKAQQVARQLIATVDQNARSEPRSPSSNAADGERFVSVPWTTNDLEPALAKLFGSRLSRGGPSRSGSEFIVTDKAGSAVTVRHDAGRGGLVIRGPSTLTAQVAQLIQANDGSRARSSGQIRSVSFRKADPRKVQQAVEAYRSGGGKPATGSARAEVKTALPGRAPDSRGGVLVAQAPASGPTIPPTPGAPAAAIGASDSDETRERLRELGLDLDIEVLPDLEAIILRGSNRDVNEVLRIIEDIERLSAETVPEVEVYSLKYVNSEALAPMLTLIQRDLLAGKPGRVSITALGKPNSLLLVGWGDAITTIKELIVKLDQPVEPQTQLRVFRLRHAPATTASATVQEFFAKRTGLGAKVAVIADVRSNSLIVQAAPRDMAEVELLITRIDTGRSESVNQVRIFKLKNSLAANLATTLQAAMDSQRTGQGGAGGAKSSVLELLTVDPQGAKTLKSGILADVKITPDPRANSLIVSAPAASMDLIAALISQMDDSPVSVSQIKVFHIVNGDAASLVTMLRSLLPSQTATTPGAMLAKAEGETSFAPLRYSVETRTNSIIAVGSTGDLAIIEALLLRLDERDVQQRKNTVYQLRNAPALDVADAINQFLRSERAVQQAAPGTISPFQQIENEVVVVPEPVGNSLIISASPRFHEEIYKLVQKLDAQPPQVLIQVLIAEVSLTDDRQFGIEFGLQDGLLFDRSLLGQLVTTNTSTTFGNPPTTVQTQTIQAATNTPGFDFNNAIIGNSGSEKSLATAAQVGGQGLSNFALGRTSELGFGGLVLSASSKTINALLRALQQDQRLEVLSRPQVMTIDNQPAFIQVGQKVPRITNVMINQIGQTNVVALENVGLILGVTPRISPDGMVVMEIDAEKSDVAPEIEGIPISVSATGAVVRSPRYNITTAQTTVSTASGETIVLGGLITKNEQRLNRSVPYLSDIPVIGWAFRYDQYRHRRTELLIILTPHVVRSSEDAERLKQIEAARMHWCAADVHAIHGDPEFCRRGECPTCNEQMPVVYPDVDPRGLQNVPISPGAAPNDIDGSPQLDPGVSARNRGVSPRVAGTKGAVVSSGPSGARGAPQPPRNISPVGPMPPTAYTGGPTSNQVQ